MGCGCAFFDYDNDGWMTFSCSPFTLWQSRRNASNRLYKQSRRHVSDVTARSACLDRYWYGICRLRFNNDGFEDLFPTATRATSVS